MTINKTNLLAGLGAGIVVGALTLGTIGVSAQSSDLTTEEREALKAQRAEDRAEFLESKVEDGTITQEQLTQIEDWKAEQQAEREAAKEDRLTQEERAALSDEEREALKAEKQAAREERKAEAEEFFDSIGVDKEELFEDYEGKRSSKRGGTSVDADVQLQSS